VPKFLERGDSVLETNSLWLDFADKKSITRFVDDNIAGGWSIDALVVLAGILPGKSLGDYTDDEIDEVMAVNFTGPARLVRALLPHLKDGARVLLMSSISGQRGSFDPIYAASKAALIGFAKSLSTWNSRIRVSALTPSLIVGSTMYEKMLPERREFHTRQAGPDGLMTLDEVAQIIVNACFPGQSR